MEPRSPIRRDWGPVEWSLLTMIAVSPAIILLSILRLSIDFPYSDQWAVSILPANYYDGTLSLADFFGQHNESRKAFPKVIFLLLGLATRGDVRYELGASFAVSLVSLFNIHSLARMTGFAVQRDRLFLTALASALLFGLVQYANWMLGLCLVVFILPACLTGCLCIAHSALPLRSRYIGCAVLCLVATFTFANGMILWFLVLPSLLLESRGRGGAVLRGGLAWAALASATLVAYFWDYHKPGEHPSLTVALSRPVDAALYFLGFLGAPLGSGIGQSGLPASILCGLALLLLLAWCVSQVLTSSKSTDLLHRSLPWFALAAFSLGTAAANTAGRLGFGLRQAILSRYTTHSILLVIALLFLVPLVLQHGRDRGGRLSDPIRIARLTAFLSTVLVVVHGMTSVACWFRMGAERMRRLEGKACMTFLRICRDPEYERVLEHSDTGFSPERAERLDRIGFLRPPLASSADVRILADPAARDGARIGSFDAPEWSGSTLTVSGTAVLPRGEPADAVLLCSEGAASSDLFAFVCNPVAVTGGPPGSDPSRVLTGWRRTIPRNRIPAGTKRLSAWAYDAVLGRAWKLDGEHPVPEK